MEQQDGNVLGCVVLFELTELNGAERLPVKCFSLLQSWNCVWGKNYFQEFA